ncbi:MAG TPA: hypothetical protein VKB78_09200, partial [Pirellulales bacterium]|nr:hypothetical protein [Pirellulales bacterium]
IEHYQQLKPEALLKVYFNGATPPAPAARAEMNRPPATDRMLSAIVLHAPNFWFFKMVGPVDAVGQQLDDFSSLIRSVHFDKDGKPAWSLPKGWRQLPGSGEGPAARFATLQIGGEAAGGTKPLEVAVTSLPAGGIDALVMNIDRWRGQMGLGPVKTKEELAETITPVKTSDGDTAFLVNLDGQFKAGGLGGGPFAGGAKAELPAGHPPIESKGAGTISSATPPEASNEAPKFDLPKEWQMGSPDQMRAAVMTVKDGDRAAEVSITPLPPFGGGVAKNVNRWRSQLKLPEASEKEIAAMVKPITVGGLEGSYVEIVGPKELAPRETILAVIVRQSDKVWFIKLKGDADLAEREKPRFEAFVKSLKFEAAK